MSLRFRRSVRLFPGVRLNFSASGVSTTVGVRGASMTLGQRGAHMNLGLPGTGLAYRTPITPRGQAKRLVSDLPVPIPIPAIPAPGAHEIRSADIGELTSLGLGELKRLIDEVAAKRASLERDMAADRAALAKARDRLGFATSFIVRLFTTGLVSKLKTAAASASNRLAASQADLEECVVEVDFGIDQACLESYASLGKAFEALAACHTIWDITASEVTNRAAERTIAQRSFTRTPVRFDLAATDVLRTAHGVPRLGDAGGRDLHLYPAVLMMRDGDADFALIEYRELNVAFRASRFVEEETVPADSAVIDQTWHKSNKDGSPDLRFRDNFAVPIVQYGELQLSSHTGLMEAYLFSDFDKAQTFVWALERHQTELAKLTHAGGAPRTVGKIQSDHGDEAELGDGAATVLPLFPDVRPGPYVLDWLALVTLICALSFAGVWTVQQMRQRQQSAIQAPVIASVSRSLSPEEIVRAIKPTQSTLIAKGYNPGVVDGVMGRKTHQALQTYQAAVGLAPTGKIDRSTLERLGVAP